MSYHPAIGGKLRKGTSGVGRSQAVFDCWGLDPGKEIGQTCGLNVIMRRRATSHRSVVTAAKLVYSTWKINPPGERHGKAIYWNRSTSEPVHVLHPIGKREDLRDRVGAGGSSAVREEATGHRRSGGGDYVEYPAIFRCGGAASQAGRGGGYQSVPGDQPVGEEDRSPRCTAAVAVSVQGLAAGGADEG